MWLDIEDLRRLVEPPFFIKEEEVEGVQFLIVDYKLALPEHFLPLYRREFRGLTIDIDNEKIYWSIHKFFNVGETPETGPEILKKFKWEALEKVDGSLIQVIWVNGKLFAKTRKTFKSIQAKNATRLLRTSPYVEFVTWCREQGLQPLFEYVGPDNQIVVFHPDEKLVLISIRTNNGRYLKDIGDIANRFGIPSRKSYRDIDIEDIIQRAKVSEGIEGWVLVNKENPRLMVKVKTLWYLERHKIMAENEVREDYVIRLTAEGKIDDILQELRGEKAERVRDIARRVIAFIERSHAEIEYILSQYGDSREDRKSLAIEYREHPLFHVIMASFRDRSNIRENVIRYILKRASSLSEARKFLEEIK